MTASVHVIAYHAFDDGRSPLSIRPEDFRGQVVDWKSRGFRFLTIDEVHAMLTDAAPWPETDAVCLTIDDALLSVYDAAFPILREMNVPAALYLVSDYMGKSNAWPGQPDWVPRMKIMTWEHAAEMARHGVTIGSHTRTHPDLAGLALDALDNELTESKKAIEDRLGAAVETIAFPYGRTTPETNLEVCEFYKLALAMRMKPLESADDPMRVPRVDSYYLRAPLVYRSLGKPAGKAYLGARALLRELRGRR